MRTRLFNYILFILSLLVVPNSAQAANTLTYAGALTTSNINFPEMWNCTEAINTSAFIYHAQPFYVGADGDYTLHVTSAADARLILYQVAFNPASCIACNQDFQTEITASLTANTQYMVVTSAEQTGTFTVDISGPGSIHLNDVIANDEESPVALYSVDYNTSAGFGLHIYQANPDGTQTLALEITPDMLQNSLSDKVEFISKSTDGLVQVFRLPNGKWQVNAIQRSGKMYVAIFDSTASGAPLYGYVM